MIIRKEDRTQELSPHLRGGDGVVEKLNYVVENGPANGKMFAELRLEPGCSIGTHSHIDEYEIFFYEEGEIVLNDNGVERIMHPGDFSICRDGECHGIANRTDRPASVYAVIVRTK